MISQLHNQLLACVDLLILDHGLLGRFVEADLLLIRYHILLLALRRHNILDETQNVLAIVDTEADKGVQDQITQHY